MNGEVYLNHAGTSWPKPESVIQAVGNAMSASTAQWPSQFEQAHRELCEFFGVHQPEQILLTPGCTSALAVAINDVHIPAGRRVLTSEWEHHAVHRPVDQLSARGVPVNRIPSLRDPETRQLVCPIDLDWLQQALAAGDVGLIAITAACNVTGELLPYEDVIGLARQYETTVLLDAAQIVGWKHLDLPQLGADMVAFGGHKGLRGPWGIGGLYLSDRVAMNCGAATCELPGANGDERSPRPGYCDVGSVDRWALAGLQAAVGALRQREPQHDLAAARSQIRRIRESLERFDRLRFLSPPEPDQSMPVLALDMDGMSSHEVAAVCRKHLLEVGSGLMCAPSSHRALGTDQKGLVRLSVGRGQPESEIEEAIHRLTDLFGRLSDRLDCS